MMKKKQDIQELADYDTFMQNLEQEQQDAFNAMKKMAEKLSQVRQRSAKKVRRRDLWSDERTEFS